VPDPEIAALRQRLGAVEAYAHQVTQELELVRAQLAEVSARPAAPAPEPWPDLLPPVDLSPPLDTPPLDTPAQYDLPRPVDLPEPVDVPEQVELPEYAAVYRQIELPETPPIWAGPPTAASALSLDIPLVAPEHPQGAAADLWPRDELSVAAVPRPPLIDTVPTVTRRAS
jgi:hypothetical protein